MRHAPWISFIDFLLYSSNRTKYQHRKWCFYCRCACDSVWQAIVHVVYPSFVANVPLFSFLYLHWMDEFSEISFFCIVHVIVVYALLYHLFTCLPFSFQSTLTHRFWLYYTIQSYKIYDCVVFARAVLFRKEFMNVDIFWALKCVYSAHWTMVSI